MDGLFLQNAEIVIYQELLPLNDQKAYHEQ